MTTWGGKPLLCGLLSGNVNRKTRITLFSPGAAFRIIELENNPRLDAKNKLANVNVQQRRNVKLNHGDVFQTVARRALDPDYRLQHAAVNYSLL